jgi:hypothetical protein
MALFIPESACARFGTDQYCCRREWAPRSECDPAKWPVDYAAVFKKAEPYAYSYVDDDATSVFTCKGRCARPGRTPRHRASAAGQMPLVVLYLART